MNSFISSRGASPECVCTGRFAAWHAAHTGSYDGMVVRRVVAPHRRDHDPADAGLVGEPLDLRDRARRCRDRSARGRCRARRSGLVRAQLDEEAVVRARARERELGVFDHSRREARAERRRLHAGDRVGVGEDDLGRDAVGVHLLVALRGVVRAAQAFFVRRSPSW